MMVGAARPRPARSASVPAPPPPAAARAEDVLIGATEETEEPPIGDYALIGDGRAAALVSRRGSIDWLCLPHFSGPSLFAAILDRRRGGRFAIRPTGPFTVGRRYAGASAVLETSFATGSGVARLTDLMPILVGAPCADALQPHHELLRIVEGVEGEVELEILFAPRPDYGRRRVRLTRRGALGWRCEGRDALYLAADAPLALDEDGATLHGRIHVKAGETLRLSLSYSDRTVHALPTLDEEAEARRDATLDWWERWSGRCAYDGPWREAVVRSAITLKSLTYGLSGAVVAAPTASLPETIGGARNWDYRYCWLRDASLTLEAFLGLGYVAEGEAFLDWMLHATRLTRPRLQVLYDVFGETKLRERTLDHFHGYRGSRPVRIGNDARGQRQLDLYGAVIQAACDYVERGGRLDGFERRLLKGFGEIARRCWREPDESIWEIRSGRRHYVYSKIMCWTAFDRLIRLAERGCLRAPRGGVWEREREAIRQAIERRGRAADGGYVGFFGGDAPDAALLLLPRLGYVEAGDPRMTATWERIRRELDHDGLMARYPHGYDGHHGAEGAFGICSFWAVDYLARAGRLTEARARFERVLGCANDVGLFGEETDRETGEVLGNFPQAFTHVGLIAAARTLARAEATEHAA